jgi:predicted transcriptional regulator
LKAPQSARYLLEEVLQKTFQTTNKRNYLQPLMEMGLLELTDKTNIKSRYQQYSITEKGVEFLATILKE